MVKLSKLYILNEIFEKEFIMECTFKAFANKEWTISEKGIFIDKKEILFSDIESANLYSRPRGTTHGMIEIVSKGKTKLLGFPMKQSVDGMKAFDIILQKSPKGISGSVRLLSEIDAEISSLPSFFSALTEKEINALPNILKNDENIKGITSGIFEGNTWLLLCTTKRIVMLDKGLILGSKQSEIPLHRINSISFEKGLAFGKIFITDGAVTRQISNIENKTIQSFIDSVNNEIDIIMNKKISETKIVNQVSSADEILKFKLLMDQGIITQVEFDKKKKSLLEN